MMVEGTANWMGTAMKSFERNNSTGWEDSNGRLTIVTQDQDVVLERRW
jgi:hypothetical protein